MSTTMVAARKGAGGGQQGQQPQQVPFLLGSAQYIEQPFDSFTAQLGGAQIPVTPVWEVTPGNFLDGVTLSVTSTGGVLGTTAALTADGTLDVINYIAFSNTAGGEILYPMGLLEYVMAQKYLRPWAGDPTHSPQYSNSINPAVTVDLSIAIRETLAILSNTDARATYRLRITLAPITSLVTVTTGVTAPTVTVAGSIRSWAQPPAADYMNRPINPYPPGLGVQRKLMAQTENVPASGTARIRLDLVGNEIRGLILIFRTSAGVRHDLTDDNAGPITFRLDNQVIWTMLPSQIIDVMLNFYSVFYGGRDGVNRETGVYTIPRFRGPVGGNPWLPTVEQSYLYVEFGSSDVASGTIEVIYDQLAVGQVLPPSMESI